MDEFNAALDAALAADFRALTYHWAIDMEPVFGRENVPDLSNDFDRIVERILMVFGLSQTMLTGASGGRDLRCRRAQPRRGHPAPEPLPADACQVRLRPGAIVAEAQGHFDYEVRNGKRYLITEEIYEIDEETGRAHCRASPSSWFPNSSSRSSTSPTRSRSDSSSNSGRSRRAGALSCAHAGWRDRLRRGPGTALARSGSLAVQSRRPGKKTYLALLRQGLPIIEPDNSEEQSPRDYLPTGRLGKPRVVGMRAYLNLGGTPTRVARKGAYAEEPEDSDSDGE
jgi:hypothetical protein